MVRRSIPLFLIVGLTLAGGAFAGVFGNRWGAPADLLAAGAQLAEVPAHFGDWRLDAETPLTDDDVAILGCTGNVSRRYLNRATGETVHVVVIVGPPGKISVHTPEVCYDGAGYRQTGRRKQVTVHPSEGDPPDGGASHDDTAEFWRTPFVSETRDGLKLAVYYAWSDGGAWSAPTRPRFSYGGRPCLYKIQLDAPLVSRRGGERDFGRDFLAEFIPALKRAGIPAGLASGGR